MNQHRLQPYASLIVIISGICYGLLGLFGTELLLLNFSVVCMLFWRFLIAGVWMIRPYRSALPSQSLSALAINVLSYCGGSFFYFIAIPYTGTGIAMTIFFSFPLFVFLFSFFLQKKPFSLLTAITLAMLVLGLFLLKGQSDSSIDVTGLFYALLAALCYAIYVYRNRQKSDPAIDTRLQTLLICFGCALVFLLLTLYAHEFMFPVTLKAWIYIAALGIIATALPIQLMLEGMKHISAVRASILTVFEPLVTVLVGCTILHESISVTQLIGMLVILSSVIGYQWLSEKDPSTVSREMLKMT